MKRYFINEPARIRLIVFLSVISLTLNGCKKFISIDPSPTELITTSVFSNEATANSAILSIYSQLENSTSFPYFISLYGGFLSDELMNYSSDLDNISIYGNDLSPLSPNIERIWNTSYNYIYQLNNIIENIEFSEVISNPVKKQIIGEAKFTRSFIYFYLIQMFGDVPFVTSTNYRVNSTLSRNFRDSIYHKLIIDLKDAKANLQDHFVAVDGISISAERIRPSKWAASALLARIYLYRKDYANAEEESSYTINHNELFSLNEDLKSVFLSGSKEAIWQLQPSDRTGYNTPEGKNFILVGAPEPGEVGRNSTLSPWLLNSFKPNDKRRASWVDSISANSEIYYYPSKYKISNAALITEYSTIFRLAEQYLIRAESRLFLGKTNAAKEDIDSLKLRAGLELTTSTDQAVLLQELEYERRIELFAEMGHRWFDLKRTGKANSIMASITPLKGGTWGDTDTFFPIPQSERNKNGNLTQNDGY